MIIYLITCLSNNKLYVGQTIRTLDRRWWGHVNDAKSEKWDYPLHRAIRKYGKENFKIEILTICSSIEELNEKEIHYIELHRSLAPNGYNLHTGGRNHTASEYSRQKMSKARKGKKHRPESIQKMSESQKGRTLTLETIEKMSKTHTGKILTQDHKDNISKAQTGKITSKETKEKLSIAHTGKVFTKEHCENMSKSKSGKILSEEKRTAISKGHEGIKQSEETKLKLSLMNKGKRPNVGIIRPIFCHQTGEVYVSFGNAAKKLLIPRPGIQRSLKSGIPYHGYTFEYAKEDKKQCP